MNFVLQIFIYVEVNHPLVPFSIHLFLQLVVLGFQNVQNASFLLKFFFLNVDLFLHFVNSVSLSKRFRLTACFCSHGLVNKTKFVLQWWKSYMKFSFFYEFNRVILDVRKVLQSARSVSERHKMWGMVLGPFGLFVDFWQHEDGRILLWRSK